MGHSSDRLVRASGGACGGQRRSHARAPLARQAARFGVSRTSQDEFALASHRQGCQGDGRGPAAARDHARGRPHRCARVRGCVRGGARARGV